MKNPLVQTVTNCLAHPCGHCGDCTSCRLNACPPAAHYCPATGATVSRNKCRCGKFFAIHADGTEDYCGICATMPPPARCPHPAKQNCSYCGERFCPNDGCDPNHRENCREAMRP